MTDDIVARVLLELGCDPSYAGFDITVEAVHLIMDDPSLETKVSQRLYPMLAEKFKVSAGWAERSIRYMLRKMRETPGFMTRARRVEERTGISMDILDTTATKKFLILMARTFYWEGKQHDN